MRLRSLLGGSYDPAAWRAATGTHFHLRIGNDPTTIDQAVSLAALQRFMSRVAGFGRGYCDLWQWREAVFVETDVQYVDRSGGLSVIPCAILARFQAGALVDLRFYLDPAPIP